MDCGPTQGQRLPRSGAGRAPLVRGGGLCSVAGGGVWASPQQSRASWARAGTRLGVELGLWVSAQEGSGPWRGPGRGTTVPTTLG